MRLGVLVQGKKVVTCGDRSLAYAAGTYLVITEASSFESQIVSASHVAPYLALSVELPTEVVVETWMALKDAKAPEPGCPSPPRGAPPSAYVSSLDPMLSDTCHRLVRTLDGAADRAVLLPIILRELVFRLLRSDSAAAVRQAALRNEDQLRIRRAMAYIRDHAAERVTVEALARHVSMSPSHFAHRFRAVARTSPIQYLKQVRMQRARLMLMNEGARPSEVAERVGYASVAHFTREFRSNFGQTPGAMSSARAAQSGER